MALQVEIPREIPVMTLPEVVLFPHAMLPLYIFEERYRRMLQDVLESDRLFVVAGQDMEKARVTGEFEPPFGIASVGVIRASHLNEDATSNLIIQGLARVRIRRILSEEPYRLVEIESVATEPGAQREALAADRLRLTDLLLAHGKLGGEVPEEIMEFLGSLKDEETFLDLAAFTLCPDGLEKQRLLETFSTAERFSRFFSVLQRANENLVIDNKLRGGLPDDRIELN
ncbi:LON peptidase substrate-binding domain-containing protein [Ruficoccus amylovorans]|uniref:LON peptidase substrate-binding domain-containing protein n=1 Tax=Ruficoccus amylovorans TaxID=1804625 RepID=A0A842HAJ6_9BACT|nr:LON peptidase substrate-binding domain-containing protein [Ruficoccus amylovorans]MBC2593108.1 LON peptidase substrate-binding domain-containing protein [Ruficoccus amylovorans]